MGRALRGRREEEVAPIGASPEIAHDDAGLLPNHVRHPPRHLDLVECRRGQFLLGGEYAWGEGGTAPDTVQAYKWMILAAAGGSGDTQEFYAANRDTIAAQLTAAEIAEAKRLAREWTAAFEKRQKK